MTFDSLLSLDTPILLTIAVLIGLILGLILARLSLNKKLRKASEMQAVEQEFKDYKAQVDDHFVETASLVNQMTKSYKDVYEHLEKGAFGLVGENVLQERLIGVNTEPIMLSYIGQKPKLEPVAELDVNPLRAAETKADSFGEATAN